LTHYYNQDSDICILKSNIVAENFTFSYIVLAVLPLFLSIKMSAITTAERLMATNAAGINDETRESTLSLPNG
jgi:hypothetical protein